MTIQIDSREKARAIKKIQDTFTKSGVNYYISKLFVGDYMSLDNPRLVIDRKQNLSELCANVCQQHERFRREIVRANQNGIRLIFLCEHGHGIESLEDIVFWENPRSIKRIRTEAGWKDVHTKATTGATLYKILNTIRRKYDVDFVFCDKNDTGKMIIDILTLGVDS